ncbi:MAG: hypothetical protein A2W90_24455 [Bacteroidetes bacterium GWF2_42_66]|nr:MAG: hypothetical protein A2W92_09125 [Bacteroidetes bacterium GWA2_42_15]OFX97920.1 MAG: hypothetical protein A2W89_07640 [Bacteroidetes bacterium GWE2_42_39]OFY45842.1 MAG: hypothetical protein A2W90_24455 [Bacteroidetes bacterium GWF2_42_66]HBL74656.1 hypothetical protein [Prolixibacteraceae bacterium]HCR89341.1 hypothetical protein [Prolixibacteraceae bacterium]
MIVKKHSALNPDLRQITKRTTPHSIYFTRCASLKEKQTVEIFSLKYFLYFSILKNQDNRKDMFTFGILSSHIPYVAFVAFYLFYLLFPSQFKQDDPANTDDKKIVFIERSYQAEQVQQPAISYYFQADAEIQEQPTDISPEHQVITQIPVLNNNQGPGIQFYSPLFSRPPPVL